MWVLSVGLVVWWVCLVLMVCSFSNRDLVFSLFMGWDDFVLFRL